MQQLATTAAVILSCCLSSVRVVAPTTASAIWIVSEEVTAAQILQTLVQVSIAKL